MGIRWVGYDVYHLSEHQLAGRAWALIQRGTVMTSEYSGTLLRLTAGLALGGMFVVTLPSFFAVWNGSLSCDCHNDHSLAL